MNTFQIKGKQSQNQSARKAAETHTFSVIIVDGKATGRSRVQSKICFAPTLYYDTGTPAQMA